MSDYYPEFYLRKRQREQAYRRMTVIVVGLLIFIGLGAVVGYIAFNAITTRRTPPGATPQLAEQQQQLQTAEQIASSSVPDDVLKQTAPQTPVDLKSVNYSESFPQVDVKIEGAESKTDGDATTADSPADDASDPHAPAVGRDGDAGTGSDSDANAAGADTPGDSTADSSGDGTNSAGAPKPEQDTRIGSVTPSAGDDDARRKADQLKRQEQAKREAEKREAAKKADEKKKRDELKKKLAEERATAAKADQKDKPKDDSVRAPATKSGGYSYTVYGGTYLSGDEAEKDRAKLSAIGLSGTVISTAGDYLLLVGRLDDQDSAAALASKLHSSGFGSAFVTRKAK